MRNAIITNIKDDQARYILQVVNAKAPVSVYVWLIPYMGNIIFSETADKKKATRFTKIRAEQFVKECKEKLVFGIIELTNKD